MVPTTPGVVAGVVAVSGVVAVVVVLLAKVRLTPDPDHRGQQAPPEMAVLGVTVLPRGLRITAAPAAAEVVDLPM